MFINLIRSFILFAILLLSSIGSLYAQPDRQGPPIPDSAAVVQQVQDLSVKLTLTEEQRVKIIEIRLANFAKLRTIMEDDSVEREVRREKIQSIRKAANDEITALLTPEQAEKFKEILKELEKRRRPTRD